MKKHWLLCIFSFLSLGVFSQNTVIASINNFENSKGICRACLFNSPDAFEKQNPLQCTLVTVANNQSKAEFTNIPDGTYAIFVFHDRNRNGMMDTNWLGIPKEGYGASKNKLPFAAAPKFEANKFVVAHNSTFNLSIRLRNL
ncbi:MAG: DUF2141 domain-containing protein [Bacteroidota bacterium]